MNLPPVNRLESIGALNLFVAPHNGALFLNADLTMPGKTANRVRNCAAR